MKTIFLIGAFNGLFFSLLLIAKQKKGLHDFILASMLILLGLFTGVYGLTGDYLFHDYPLTSAALISLFMLPGPFIYLYLSILARGNARLRMSDSVHFLPFIAFLIYLLTASLFPSVAEGISMEHIHYYNEAPHTEVNTHIEGLIHTEVPNHSEAPLLFNVFLILTALSGPFYFVLSYKLFKKHDINIFNNYSSQKGINLIWLKRLVLIFGLVWTALMIIAAIHHVFSYFSLSFCTDGLALTLSVFIILIGWYGFRQNEIFYHSGGNEQEFITEPSQKYSGSGISDERVGAIASNLEELMREKKPYLDPDLSLPILAEMLNIPSHHLSRVINEQFGMNFFDFINRYRIEEIKVRITDPEYQKLTILGIAMDCGFNSKSAFNRLFKKYTGTTPSLFKANQQ